MKRHFILLFCFLIAIETIFSQQLPVRKISVSKQQVEGKTIKIFKECVGAGRAGEGLRADWQQQLATVQKEISFNYIRFHGLLNDEMRVYTEDKTGAVVYNWQYVDKLFDYLLSIHIRPFVELSFMPPDLASGTKTVFWWKGNVTKPKSYARWDSLITQLVSHWQQRYGEKEIRTWYFEVWNEPDLKGFFDGTQADYFELYNHTTKAVKAVSKNYRVGGPATSATKWINEFLHYCDSAKLAVDFVSTHDYGTTSVVDEFGTKRQKLKSNPDTVALNVKKVRGIIDASSFKNAELHFTEWNTSPSSRDPMHDSYQNATYVLNTLKKTGNSANSLSYWTFTDIFEEAGPGPTPFHGGFGLINLQGIKKPTYYAYKFLNELGETTLKNTDASSYITASGNSVQALIWNYTFTETGTAFNQGYFAKEQSSQPCETVDLQINHLQNGKYRMEIYTVGYKQNDPLTAYMAMNKPPQITREQEAILRKASNGLPVRMEEIVIENNVFKKKIPLKQNDIFFIKLIKLK